MLYSHDTNTVTFFALLYQPTLIRRRIRHNVLLCMYHALSVVSVDRFGTRKFDTFASKRFRIDFRFHAIFYGVGATQCMRRIMDVVRLLSSVKRSCREKLNSPGASAEPGTMKKVDLT